MGLDVGPSSIGTAFIQWPPYPCADDVFTMLYVRRHPEGSRWKIGRSVWLRIVQLKDGRGQYLFSPYPTGKEDELTLLGLPVDILDNNRDAFYIEEPNTGRTERLSVVCKGCHGENPANARFCIACGAPMGEPNGR